jgi:hypothetical protein
VPAVELVIDFFYYLTFDFQIAKKVDIFDYQHLSNEQESSSQEHMSPQTSDKFRIVYHSWNGCNTPLHYSHPQLLNLGAAKSVDIFERVSHSLYDLNSMKKPEKISQDSIPQKMDTSMNIINCLLPHSKMEQY